MKRLTPILVLLLLAFGTHAQDIHFSQFSFSPLNLNPANAGMFTGDARFVANYKNQWSSVPVPFNTFSGSVDFALVKMDKDKVGGGATFFWDQAGDSKLSFLQINLSLSYIKHLKIAGVNHYFSIGVQPGFVQRSIDYSALYFDNQWNGDTYDPNIPVNESFDKDGFNYFDLGIGGGYRLALDDRNKVDLGIAINHLTQPTFGFFEDDEDVTLNMKYTAHAKAQIKTGDNVDLIPDLLYQRQDTKQEIVSGLLWKIYMDAGRYQEVAFYTGAYYRWGDAAIAKVGLQYNNIYAGLSYDTNVSRLNKASSFRGGLEGSFIYILTQVKNYKTDGSICPIF